MRLPIEALPGIYHSADSLAVMSQIHYLRASRLRLAFLVAAAVAGAIQVTTSRGIDLAAVVTVVALVGAVLVGGWLAKVKPEQAWYDGRALAESVKTLSWRFAVGAVPFPRSLNQETAELQFVEQVGQLVRDAPPSTVDAGDRATINDTLRSVRDGSLTDRKDLYLRARIDDQREWYSTKAKANERSATHWQIALGVTEAFGMCAALLRAIGVVDIDLAGIVAAVAGAGVAWLSIRQHETLERAYSRAANELAIVRDRLMLVRAEDPWASEAGDAEEAISREHVMWRASRATVTVG
jgi:hypothetical protein